MELAMTNGFSELSFNEMELVDGGGWIRIPTPVVVFNDPADYLSCGTTTALGGVAGAAKGGGAVGAAIWGGCAFIGYIADKIYHGDASIIWSRW